MYSQLRFITGTLVTTDDTYVRVWNSLLQPYGLSVDDNFFTTFIKGKSDLHFLKYLMPDVTEHMLSEFSQKKDDEFVKQLQQASEEGRDPKHILIPGVEQFMHKIKNSRIAIVTSCNRKAADYIVEV